MKKHINLFIIVLSFILVSNLTEGHQTNVQLPQFTCSIKTIKQEVVDLTNIFQLHRINEFNKIYKKPLLYKDSVIQYLRRKEGYEEKLIAMCSMTKLPVEDYLQMITLYYGLYKEHFIDEKLLTRSIFNNFDTNKTTIREYKNVKIQKLSKKLLHDRTLSREFKILIKNLSTGKIYRDLYNAGQLNY